MNKKSWIWIVLAILVIVAGVLIYKNNAQKQQNEDVIKIGAILPLTGDIAFLGVPVKNTLELFKSEYNNSSNNRKIDIIYGDSKANAKDAVSEAQKMLSRDKVDVFMPFLTNVCLALQPVAESNNKFTLALSTFPPIANSDVCARIFYDFQREAEVISEFLKAKEVNKVLVFESNDAATKFQVDTFLVENLKNRDIDYKITEFEVGEKNFKNILPKDLYEYNTYLILGFGSDFPQLLRTLNSYGINGKNKLIVGGIGMFEVKRDTPFELVENTYFTVPSYLLSENELFRKYRERYTNTYKVKEPSFMAVLSYDNMLALEKMLKSNPNIDFNDGKEVKKQFSKIGTYDGLTGSITITEKAEAKLNISLVQYDKNYEQLIGVEPHK